MDNTSPPKFGASFWDERYANNFAMYGTTANDFVRAVAHRIPEGPVLVIAAGEGRDAVFAAELGHQVTAIDLSSVGLENAQTLAAQRGVELETIVADLADFDFGESCWAGIISVWAHVPPALRKKVHASCVRGLMPGGVMVFEAYAPEHLNKPGKGGPPNVELLVEREVARQELNGLDFELCQEVLRDVQEGEGHVGLSLTTQVLAVKPL